MAGSYKDTVLGKVYLEWNKKHKTYVFLELPSQIEILELHSWLTEHEDTLSVPSAIFKEPALNDSVTAISFVAPEKLCLNIQFLVRNFKNFLIEEHQINDFLEVKSGINYFCKISNCHINYEVEKESFRVVVPEDGEMVEHFFNVYELEYFIKVRFLRLKN